MEQMVYLENEISSPGVLTVIEPENPYETALTSNFIMEQFTPFLMQYLNNMMDEKFNELYLYIDQLTSQISDLKNHETDFDEPNVIIIEEMTKAQAKEKIIEFFKSYDEEIYPSDLSEQLHINYELVWEILKELDEEGIIKTED